MLQFCMFQGTIASENIGIVTLRSEAYLEFCVGITLHIDGIHNLCRNRLQVKVVIQELPIP